MGITRLDVFVLYPNFSLRRVNYFNDADVWCRRPSNHYFTTFPFGALSNSGGRDKMRRDCVALHMWCITFYWIFGVLTIALIWNGNQSNNEHITTLMSSHTLDPTTMVKSVTRPLLCLALAIFHIFPFAQFTDLRRENGKSQTQTGSLKSNGVLILIH